MTGVGDVIARRGEAVYATLKREILDLTLTPGSPLSEADIERRMGASRTPIRESLQRLNAEGLVRLVPRKGAFVSTISAGDIVGLFQMREALETYVARAAAGSPRHEQIASLVPELRAAVAQIGSGTHQEYYALTARMDAFLVDLAAAPRVRAALQQVWEQIYRVRRLAAAAPGRLLDSVDEHVAIVSAVARGDGEAAAREMAGHVRASLRHILLTLSDGTPVPAAPPPPDDARSR